MRAHVLSSVFYKTICDTKTKVTTYWPITKDINSPINQSELKAKRKAREKSSNDWFWNANCFWHWSENHPKNSRLCVVVVAVVLQTHIKAQKRFRDPSTGLFLRILFLSENHTLCYCPMFTTSVISSFVILQGKGTWKTYWLISAVRRPSIKVRDKQHLHPNGQPLMNYLNTPGHHFGSNSSLNIKRTDSLRRSMKGNSPALMKKSWHKTDDESAALLNQTTVWWRVLVFARMMNDFLACCFN